MKDFKPHGSKFGGKKRSGGFSGGDSDRPRRGGFRSGGAGQFRSAGPMELHEATCAECGKTCEVPFKPNGKKPVYCRDCFKKSEGSDFLSSDRPRRDFRPSDRSSAGPSSSDMAQLNRKLDKIIELLEASLS